MTTPNIGLSEVPSNILQPSVPINDAFQLIDALLPGVVQAITATPPTTVEVDAGKVWIVDVDATGAWTDKDGQLAIATGAGLWRFVAPQAGWRFDVAGVPYRYLGTEWAEGAGAPDDNSVTTSKIADEAVTAAKLAADVAEIIRDTIGATLVAGSGVTITVDDAGNTITIAATATGAGDVAGPGSATADALAIFDGTTGKLIKDSGETLASMRRIPQNSQSAAYTLVLSDAGKHLLHPSADTTARVFTIPANSAVAFPIGTAVTFVNQNGAGALTIAINTNTLRLAGAGTTGSRTLAPNGIATAIKVTATEWLINGTGLG